MIFEDWDDYNAFRLTDPPSFLCPTCEQGKLILAPESIQKEETVEARDERKKRSFKEWKAQYLINTYLTCSRVECQEKVSMTGIIHSDKPKKDGIIHELVTPLFFIPIIHLFKVPLYCPYEVSYSLLQAFKLFWCDPTACANKIRTCIEHILTDEGIKRFEIKKGKKRRALVLHERIELYREKDAELAQTMMAIKFIGNAGSHAEELEMDEIVVGMHLLKLILENLYSDDGVNIIATRDYIVKTKKPSAFLY